MLWKREPALFYGVINAVIALAVSFGLDLSAEQTGGILAVTSAALALITRQSVTPASAPPDEGGESLVWTLAAVAICVVAVVWLVQNV